MTFLLDVCVSHRVAEFLRNTGHEAVLVADNDPELDDERILAWAAEKGFVLVTNDKDFGRHIFQTLASHAGLVRLPNAPGVVLTSLIGQIVTEHLDDLANGAIVTASATRIRVRRLK